MAFKRQNERPMPESQFRDIAFRRLTGPYVHGRFSLAEHRPGIDVRRDATVSVSREATT